MLSPNGTSTAEMVWQSRKPPLHFFFFPFFCLNFLILISVKSSYISGIRSHPIITSLGFHVCLPFSRFTNSLVGFPRNCSISSSVSSSCFIFGFCLFCLQLFAEVHLIKYGVSSSFDRRSCKRKLKTMID